MKNTPSTIVTNDKTLATFQDSNFKYNISLNYNNQYLISPSSIPNPNPSISTRPSLPSHKSAFIAFAPYNSPVLNESYYQMNPFLPKTTDCQSTFAISNCIPSTKLNLPAASALNNSAIQNKNEKEKSKLINVKGCGNKDPELFSKTVNDRELSKDKNVSINVDVNQPINMDQMYNKNAEVPNVNLISLSNILNKPILKTSIPVNKLEYKCLNSKGDVYSNNKPITILSDEVYNLSKSELKHITKNHGIFTQMPETKDQVIENVTNENFISNNDNAKTVNKKTDLNFMKKTDDNDNACNDTICHESVADVVIDNKNVTTVANNMLFPEKPNDDLMQQQYAKTEKEVLKKSISFTNQTVPMSKFHNLITLSNIHEEKLANKQSKDCLLLNDNIQENKVVALKRLHQDNVDENDFENLITENQIYGNKIVIKEKSQSSSSNDSNKYSSQSYFDVKSSNHKDIVIKPNFVNMNNILITNPSQNDVKLIQNKKNDEYILGCQNMVKEQPDIIVSINNKMNFVNHTFKTVNPLTQSLSYVKTNLIESSKDNNNILQNILNNSSQPNSNTVRKSNKFVYQVPLLMEGDDCANLEIPRVNEEINIPLPKQPVTKSELQINHSKIIKIPEKEEVVQEEVLSSIDLAEKRRRKRKEQKKSKPKSTKTAKQNNSKNVFDEVHEFRLSFKQYQMYVGIVGEKYFEDSTSEESESESENDEDEVRLKEINNIISATSLTSTVNENMVDFLNNFDLTTIREKKERELQRVERSVKLDTIISAKISLADCGAKQNKDFSLSLPKITGKTLELEDQKKVNDKLLFLNKLQLGIVSKNYKIEHEKMWQCVLKDRKKRNGESVLLKYFENLSDLQCKKDKIQNVNLINTHARGQLEIMTEIKKSVNENNNLIKRAIDGINNTCQNATNNESIIPVLAEKNFTEISKLSNMANKSLKIFGRHRTQESQDSEKPTAPLALVEADSENSVPQSLNIPNVPKIISLKSTQAINVVDISSATSMDEPQNSAAGIGHENQTQNQIVVLYSTPQMNNSNAPPTGNNEVQKKCETKQQPNEFKWPGVEQVMMAYKQYNEECTNEHLTLIQENSKLLQKVMMLQAEITNISVKLRALLSKQQVCEQQQRNLQASLDNINNCIDYIMKLKNY